MQVQVPAWIRVIVVLGVVVALTWRMVVDISVDWLWFDALGHLPVYQTSLATRATLLTASFLVAALSTLASLAWASRQAPVTSASLRRLSTANGGQAGINIAPRSLQRLTWGAMLGVSALVGSMFSESASTAWLDILAFVHQQPFDAVDPVFGHDIGFYVFTLPVLRWLHGNAVALVLLVGLATTVWYLLQAAVSAPQRPTLGPAARRHLLALAATLSVTNGFGLALERYDLLVSRHGAVVGVGYADAHARLPGYWLAIVAAMVAAGAFVWVSRKDGWRPAMIVGAAYVGIRMLSTGIVPQMTEEYVVQPSQLDLERDYLQRNIHGTRSAYALDRIEVRPFEAAAHLTPADIQANPLTVENIRVWDTRPLLTTYAQLQEIRTYYDFLDVDVDRYTFDGSPRQVMIAAREMNVEALGGAQNWVNRHLQYTHGYGLTMSPVNVVTPEGLPELFVQDIPPVDTVGLNITQPEIYYGESTNDYVIVRTGEREFDYPMGDTNVTTTYEGKGGVVLSSFFRKLVVAAHFETLDLLLSQYLRDDSRAMFRRNLRARVSRVAPFLTLDNNPYPVVHDGRLVWILDAYTTSDRYPYSESTRFAGNRLNYIRNSAKVVVDAYDGTVQVYISDPSDPIVRVFADVFPTALLPLDDMDAGLRAHLRYPTDFFDIQAELYSRYHMQDSTVFFNQEDIWEFPKEQVANESRKMDSYYLIMRLPGEEAAEFILLVPFVPRNKDNLIAWMAARSDGEQYGRLLVYTFPKQKLIFGPSQIEARIDQTPEISELMTLWSQAGSRVIRGNLLVIPIEDSLMYVEPVYLEASHGQLPELKRIIVAHEKRIAMASTLDEALAQVFGPMPENLPPAAPVEPPGPPTARADRSMGVLAQEARATLARAEERQQAGDWAGYGEALVELREILAALDAASSAAEPPAP